MRFLGNSVEDLERAVLVSCGVRFCSEVVVQSDLGGPRRRRPDGDGMSGSPCFRAHLASVYQLECVRELRGTMCAPSSRAVWHVHEVLITPGVLGETCRRCREEKTKKTEKHRNNTLEPEHVVSAATLVACRLQRLGHQRRLSLATPCAWVMSDACRLQRPALGSQEQHILADFQDLS